MNGKISTIYQGLTSNLKAALERIFGGIPAETVHVHHTNVGYADDPEMQTLITRRMDFYPKGATHSHDPHSLSPLYNHLGDYKLVVIDSINLFLSNIYLLNNKQAEPEQSVEIVKEQVRTLRRFLFRSNLCTDIIILSSMVSGDIETRTLQGLAYQRAITRLNQYLATISHHNLLLTNVSLLPFHLLSDLRLFEQETFREQVLAVEAALENPYLNLTIQ